MILNRERRTALLTMILVASSLSIGVLAKSSGISGYSQGCGACHTRPTPTGVTVDVVGIPPTYTPSQTYTITITALGGPAGISGGFDMSVTAGTLAEAPGETNVQIDNGEAIHISENGRSWQVDWTAPAPGTGDVTIYVAVLCGNGGNGANNDDWEAAQFTSTEAAATNTAPTITITSPSGTSDWTGGSAHDVTFATSDPEDAPAILEVWLNYSVTGGTPWMPVAGAQGIAGDSSPFSWSLPLVDSTTVAINATVKDSGLLEGYGEVLIPTIDSTPPTILSTLPLALEPNAPVTTTIETTFDEGMDTVSVETAFELRDTVTWTLVTGSFSWILDTLIFTPSVSLIPGTNYQVNITTAASDDSDPGNPIVSQYEWTFTTVVLNAPPSISISAPAGGERWSGGSVHDIVFTASDGEDPTGSLFVWLNYSTTGGAPWTPIAGAQAITGDSSPFSWTVPFVDSTTAVVNASVVDIGALLAWAVSGSFEVDSTPPSVLTTSPLDGASGVPLGANVLASWDEPMNTDQTNNSFVLSDNLTWTPQTGMISWAGNTFIFNPDVNMNPNEWYTANFTTLALDDSDPGNALTVTYSWSFQTAGFADTYPPSITNVLVDPTLQEVFFAVNISANVSDDVEVSLVSISIVDPLAGSSTTSMSYDPATLRFYLHQSHSIVGMYDFNITATDSSNNLNWSVGQFVIEDTTPPEIAHTPVVDGFVEMPIDITGTVTDNYALDLLNPVWLNYTDVLGSVFNITMDPVVGDDYSQQIPAQPSTGTVSYFIWAIDGEGNAAMTSVLDITILAADTQPPEILGVIATPSPQEVFSSVNISAAITDSSGVASATVEITWPDMTITNQTLIPAPADNYFLDQIYDVVGIFTFIVWTNDTNDFWNSTSGDFVIQDSTPPTITHMQVTSELTGVPIDILATVTDNYQLTDVRIDYVDVSLNSYNVSMNLISGDSYMYQIPAQATLGVVTYFIWAVDSSGNAVWTNQYDITISSPPDNQPPVADAGPDQLNNSEGASIQFDGTASTDNVGIVKYRWTFTYGPNIIALEGPTPSFTFSLVGEYAITLNVTDAAGLYGTDAMLVSVLDTTPPEMLAVSPMNGATEVSTGTGYVIVFSEAMDITATQLAISIQDVTIEDFQWSRGNTVLLLSLSGLEEDEEYMVTVNGATDVAGNPLPAESYSFTTLETPSAPPPISLEQDWWWIVLIIILIVIILMLALRQGGPKSEEPTVYESHEPEPSFADEATVTEDAPVDPNISLEETQDD